jgi:y4mF family transcriptional regulator
MEHRIGTIVPIGELAAMDTAAMGTKVRDRRRDLGLTQEELADLAGCSVRFVRFLEHGKPTLRVDKLVDLLAVLGLELDVVRRTP